MLKAFKNYIRGKASKDETIKVWKTIAYWQALIWCGTIVYFTNTFVDSLVIVIPLWAITYDIIWNPKFYDEED